MTRALLAVALVGAALWVRTLPLGLAGAGAEADLLRWRAADGVTRPFLGDFDSWYWLRLARNLVRHGTVCEAVVDGECRDTLANAPHGRAMKYARSFHAAALAAVHRVVAAVRPEQPLQATAFWLAALLGAAAALPAFALGRRIGGDLGGVVAALLVATNPMVLVRTLGSDNDVWNLLLPLVAVAAAAAALARPPGLGWLAVSVLAVGLHGVAWRGWIVSWGVVLGGMALTAAVRRDRRTIVALVVFAVAGLAAGIAGAGDAGSLALIREAFAAEAARWPDVLATVAETQTADRESVGTAMGGTIYLFAAWLGLLTLVLPRHTWRAPHFAVLIAGTILYRVVLSAPVPGRGMLLAALALPAVAALVVGRDADDEDTGARCLVAVWLLAALYLALGPQRFVFLLAPPCALAVGAALGRLDGLVAPKLPPLARPVAAGLLLATILPAAGRGWEAARTYRPRMDTAWWGTLERLRTETPPDAIVLAWWDWGHWITFGAERRVLADGASLLTHVPHWFGRAMLAPTEAESVGLLRMLACGSDTTPEPEGHLGAMDRLADAGVGEADAYDLLLALAPLDRTAADARLSAAGLDAPARDHVLAATHCRPPPAYLVLSTDEISRPGWAFVGAWDVRRGVAASGYAGYLFDGWMDCEAKDGGNLDCPAFRWRPGDPAASRVLFADEGEVPPAVIALARPDGLTELPGQSPVEVGALVDPARSRVLLAAPRYLRSTFTQLVMLDGRWAKAFERVDARTGFAGQRVLTWRVRWPE